ncbi:MAG: hypothetical protein EPO20_20775 [Betaproteobacteria bacterium]|nr:MAG: hypothetical protein EPO20_20775 [Betaproteobacteria bacterium]
MLRFDQAPPFSVPLRFFLTAPAFAFLAALVALRQGPALFESRWSPAALAITHLLTLGVLGMVMLGAMLQILPVLAGAPVARPRAVAFAVHAGLALGTLALAAGFLTAEPALMALAMGLLGFAFAVFLSALAWALWRVRVVSATVAALRLAGIALAVTVLLGLWLAAGRSGFGAMPAPALRDLHPAWGLLGWAGMLIAAVAAQVVPMFHMTPAYPKWMRWLPFAALGMLAAGWIAGPVGLYAGFAATTLWLHAKRRRRQPDVNFVFWRAAVVCSLAAALVWLATPYWGGQMLVGVLVIAGALLSVVTAMLYKIVPFLAWLHLQARLGAQAPNVRQYLDERKQRRQLWLHLLAVALLAAAVTAPQFFAYPAAILFAASAVQLGSNLLSITLEYRKRAAS